MDVHNRVVAMLGGHPRGDSVDWDGVKKEASEAIETARQACSFAPSDRVHRRGNFAALARGVSFGGGRDVGLVSQSFNLSLDSFLAS